MIRKEETSTAVPFEVIRSVVLSRNVQISSQLLCDFMSNGIAVLWLDSMGRYLGSTIGSCDFNNAELHRKQFHMYNSDSENIVLAREHISRKLDNQIVILKSFTRTDKIPKLEGAISEILKIKRKLDLADNYQKLMGYEGISARLYYSGLECLIPEEFNFAGRNRKPPRDPVNAMLSFGYTLLYGEVIIDLLKIGLNPYVGFCHKMKKGHAALASDIMEEWRPLIVDSIILNMVRSNEVDVSQFSLDGDICIMSREVKNKLIYEFNRRITSEPNPYREKIETRCNEYKSYVLDSCKLSDEVA